MLYYQSLPYVPKIIWTELISKHYDNPLAGYFSIEKIRKLVVQKYYWPTLRHNINNYVKGCDVYLVLKVVRHKPYNDLQFLPVLIHCWKDLLMDFVRGLPISTNWKGDNYDSILVIVNWLIKIGYYKPVKITINALGLAVIIINIIMRHHGLPDSIITNWGSLFTSKFWSLLCYFFNIKRRFSIVFHSQTDGQTERQNSIMEAHF